jgi:pyruvate-ferredoxin/flavodoxin oxidoreductase
MLSPVPESWKTAADEGAKQVVEVKVPESWKTAADEGLVTTHAESGRQAAVDFVNNIQAKVSAQEGNTLPVSAFKDYVDGTTPSGTSAYEKRGIAVNIPVWNPENCIQCNRCSYVCPHAAIRPVAMTEAEAAAAPADMQTLAMTGMADKKFAIVVSALDCTGCGSCANVCPGKKGAKALDMQNMEANVACQSAFDYAVTLPEKADVIAKFKEATVAASHSSCHNYQSWFCHRFVLQKRNSIYQISYPYLSFYARKKEGYARKHILLANTDYSASPPYRVLSLFR